MHRTVVCHQERKGSKTSKNTKLEKTWFKQSSSFIVNLILCHWQSLFILEMPRGKDRSKDRENEEQMTEMDGNISFIQILLEVYKCITDISKTSYPFYRAQISSKVFTTVSGRAHTKGLLQTLTTAYHLTYRADPLLPHLSWVLGGLFMSYLELKWEMDRKIPHGKGCIWEREYCQVWICQEKWRRLVDFRMLKCGSMVESKCFIEKYGNWLDKFQERTYWNSFWKF